MSEYGTTAGEHTLDNGRYVLQHLLGQGGMASVHLAYDAKLTRQVAVKTLHTELGREQSFRERFRREAQAVARLQHPNIVSVFDSGEEVGPDGVTTPYIVMEYVEGKALRDLLNEAIAQHGAMPVEQALEITAAVLSALEASHDQNLVHRDIKPGNVMVTTKGVVKVMDFGIARALQSGVTSMTQTGMVVGTPQYLSPEQALGKSVDARSDLYSVGCMLFELLTGELPFDGDSPFSIAYKHVQEEPPAPSGRNRAVRPGVDALVARALRKDPAHRFPTAVAMREELKRVLAGEQTGVNTPQAGPPLVIGEGPRSVHAAPSLTDFPQVMGDIRTPAPQILQPYQAPTPPPYGPQTPPPYPQQHTPQPYPQQQQQMPMQQQYQAQQQAQQTPQPFPQHYRTPQPFPQQAQTPPPYGPGPQGPPFVPFAPKPANSNNGCFTALVVVGVIIGVIVLAAVIVGIVAAQKQKDLTNSYSGLRNPAAAPRLGPDGRILPPAPVQGVLR
ncbi:protein kinase [Kitasatospora sp. MAP5-34]|uniref:protein kinase domain-containing protein n=1 Tax=Kitasatospora sp. MAP5-34 TaxID=3035102 RepID=UPI0024743581|nr:protein kinase [Kitasatospora sp. MAP5-34]MDH6580159.1 serine/threonine protein kinase [Kitasatospora sp. MAP5-34]